MPYKSWYQNSRTTLAVLLATGAIACAAATAAAQTPAESPMANRDFAGYIPGRCAVAARLIDDVNRHDYRDTVAYHPASDTLFTATVASLRDCEKAYAGRTIESDELLDQARVQLFTAQDEAAIASARKRLETMASRTPEERAWELFLIVTDNLAGKPARMEEARKALAELDALGELAASIRVLAHYAMASAAIRQFDDESMRAEVDAIVEIWNGLDAESKRWRYFWMLNSLHNLAAAEAAAGRIDLAHEALERLLAQIPANDNRALQMYRAVQRTYRLIGQRAAPLEARFWYNTGVTGPTRPAPGRVSLILPLQRPCHKVGNCLEMVHAARRIAKEFEGQDLDITFRIRTFGFYADTAPAPPIAEARYDSTYFLGQLGIPGALAVAESRYSFRPDGRRVNEPTTDDLNYLRATVILVDRNGIIRYIAEGWNPVFETRVTEFIRKLLDEPAGGVEVNAESG